MTIASSKLLQTNVGNPHIWGTMLDATSTTPQETPGIVRWDVHPVWGLRGFTYLKCYQSGGHTAGTVAAYLDPVAINNITAGTTFSITTSGLTADIYVGGILRCLDDAGAAGAAPEGESGIITSNTTTQVVIDTNDAFSVAAAVNDDFTIIVPFGCDTAAANDTAARVAGVAMTTVAQYSWGWYQFFGINPSVSAIAAGTAIPTEESVIVANSGLVTDGAGAAAELRVGQILHALTSDTVLRKAIVRLHTGYAYTLSNSTP